MFRNQLATACLTVLWRVTQNIIALIACCAIAVLLFLLFAKLSKGSRIKKHQEESLPERVVKRNKKNKEEARAFEEVQHFWDDISHGWWKIPYGLTILFQKSVFGVPAALFTPIFLSFLLIRVKCKKYQLIMKGYLLASLVISLIWFVI